MVSRRALLASIAGVAAASSVLAQDRPARIGWLTAQAPPSLATYLKAFRTSLASLGLEEGRHIELDVRYGNDDLGRVPELAAELVKSPVRLIVAQGSAVTVLSRLQLPVPVIYAVSSDPVSAGLAESLARPRRNMTGVTFMAAELNGKRLELLRDMIPGLKRVALIGTPEHAGVHLERDYAARVAKSMDVELDYFPTATKADLVQALEMVRRDPPQAFSILGDGFTLANRAVIIGTATDLRLPVISAWRVFAESGAICSYGPALDACYRRLAYFVDRVLKGTSVADLPVEQPAQFEVVLNMNVARALGLSLSPTVVAHADSIIDT